MLVDECIIAITGSSIGGFYSWSCSHMSVERPTRSIGSRSAGGFGTRARRRLYVKADPGKLAVVGTE